MRQAFSQKLIEAALADERVLLLTGDHGYALFDEFRRRCGDRFVNAGVAEQNMVGVAAGLAKAGYRPVVYGLSAFVPARVYEQIKLDVCYESLPVLFIGDGAGVVYSALGSSHQSAEDVAALRALPNIAILAPADEHEMRACMDLASSAESPVYLRMGKADRGAVHSKAPSIIWGDLLAIEGRGRSDSAPSIAWIATGSMVKTAIECAHRLGAGAVWSAPSLKPIDTERVARICREHDVVVTLEEHSVYGGLGSAVAEIATSAAPTWVCRIGIEDRFSQCCGSYEYLMREHGLTAEAVTARVERFVGQFVVSASAPLRVAS